MFQKFQKPTILYGDHGAPKEFHSKYREVFLCRKIAQQLASNI